MARWKLPLMAALALATLALLVAYMAGVFDRRVEPGLAPVTAAQSGDAYEVRLEEVAVTEPVAGSVEAKQATIISSRTLARITAIHVRAGDLVSEGEVLLELEKSDLQARVQGAREQINGIAARLNEAESSLQRARELHQRGLIADADRESARANRDALRAGLDSANRTLEEAQAALSYATIRAPISGRVVDRFAEPGDTAAPGAKLLSLYNPLSLRVEARVREQLALALRPAQEIPVALPTLGQRVSATIEEIVPAADPGSRSFLIKARLPFDERLLPGMYARVLVPAGAEPCLRIPADRVVEVGQLPLVVVATAAGPQRRFVRLGPVTDDGRVEVLSGLVPGDRLLPPD
ncbi:efflux RND transporter periplasmic adaptor subunit [Parahaliea mediterranea]|uniref:Efflux RND transporter periplasmic adaptor subunit n=1 Tax=Parahaliea mediterranea TaxID=651086 RepID=A0A939DJA0_9GAMM|nr:efflux RND transporter periplasmic adaptor subunit [Parahaliea mediterranea]MBN7798836.1 efflux RND transporter periplasmic adaptor subunit [Parahaliea mediterranea]